MTFSQGLKLGLVWIIVLMLAACGGGKGPAPAAPTTYSVGGTVSGLNGSITLANNGGDARTVSANGAFTFATRLTAGAGYNVTITTQPATQTCTLASASGSVAAANVSAVSVTCVTNRVTISGTLTGVQGTGVVLQNNGGDNLARTTDGNFTFATSIDAGTNYNITVLTEPTSPAQQCSIGNATGTPTANVTNVTVTCQNRMFSVGGTFATSSAGVALQLNGGNNQTFSRAGPFAFVQGVLSGSPYLVTLLSQTTGLPCVITNASGTMGNGPVTNVLVTCPEPPNFTQHPVGQTVQAPTTAAFNVVVTGTPTPTLQWQMSTDSGASWNDIPGATQTTYMTPATTVADNGKRFRVVATNSVSTVNSNVAPLAVTAQGPAKVWSTPLRISNEQGSASSPQLAMIQSGEATAVWLQFDPVNFRYDLWTARLENATGWGAPAILDTNLGIQGIPRVVMKQNGEALVIWAKYDGVRTNVWSRRYVVGSGWGSSAPIEQDDNDVDANTLKLVNDQNGNVLALWKSSAPAPGTQQYLRTAAFNGAWQPDATVLTADLGYESADLVANRDGIVQLVYSQYASYSPLLADVTAASCDITTGACVVVRDLESDTTGGWDSDPHVAINPSGVSFAVWIRLDQATGVSSLRASRTTTGVWSSTPVLIETLDTSVGPNPAVAVDSIGNAIAVWPQRFGAQSTERTTIYSNRFSTVSGWGTAEPLESQNRADDIFPSSRPLVVFGATVNAIAVWESGTGFITGGVYSSGAWELDRDIAGAPGASLTPQLLIENSGAGVAIFVQNSLPSNMPSVFISRYE